MGFQTPGFDPGPSPDDWAGLEARRAERVERATKPHGREMSATSRRIVGLVLGFVALAMVIYATLAMLGIVAI